jgi:ABC-type Fe3+-hydroxamate transport system substrate-binding protein
MFGTEPTAIWWRRPVTLAAAAGVVAGVVIGGASHSLPAASTRPMAGPALASGGPRATVTVTASATQTVTVLQTTTRTITVVVNSTVSTAPTGSPAATAVPLDGPPAGAAAPAGPTGSTSLEPPVLGAGPTTVHGRHDVQHRTPPGRLRAS